MRFFPKLFVSSLIVVAAAMVLLCSAASAHAAASTLRVGIAEEPRTLNVWMATDANSNKILSLIYPPLYTEHPETLELTPWLAKAMPVWDKETNTYTMELRQAKWSDGSPLTAEDVVFTVNTIKSFKVPKYHSEWQFVEKAEAVDKQTVRFYLEEPRATFLTRSLINYVMPKKQWAPIVNQAKKQEKPLGALLNARVEKPLGCGPFVLERWQEGNFIYLTKNPHFFGRGQTIQGHQLGPHVDAVLFKVYGTADVAILSLKKGDIDFLWWSIQPGYLEDLEQNKNIRVMINEKSALYYMGFNVRKKPFSDPALRQAAAMVIDRDFIVKRVLQGYGARMDSIVPSENRFWCAPDMPEYGRGLNRAQRIKKARKILAEAGYSWQRPPVDENGRVVSPSTIVRPDGNQMEKFTILTPPADYDPNRATCGIIIQEWLKELGIPASARPMSFGALLETVKTRHDFDAFILGYGRLALDPDYLRSFFHSDNAKPGGWNMSGYHNPEFDKLAEASIAEMDTEKRRKLLYQMQEIIMEDVPYIPLYNPAAIEAVDTRTFKGWVPMVEGIGNIWSFCSVKPE
ncbi:MAG: ABC transporter substrate-binding protein [Desulfobacterales bacterium]|nr:ABC transporter substrate-binding protein [Desulfobacterales bacterium]